MAYSTHISRRTSSDDTGWVVFVVTLLALVPLVLFRGWVLSVMWNWFIPNIFTSLPKLSVGEAIGISLVLSAFLPSSKDDKDKELWVQLRSALLTPIVLLAMGWIVQAAIY